MTDADVDTDGDIVGETVEDGDQVAVVDVDGVTVIVTDVDAVRDGDADTETDVVELVVTDVVND